MADPAAEPRLRLVSGCEVVPLGERAVAWTLGGESARLDDIDADLTVRLLPLLSGEHDIRRLAAQLVGDEPADIVATVARLAGAGVVTTSEGIAPGDAGLLAADALRGAGVGPKALAFLSQVSVAVIGGSEPAMAVARELAGFGLGEIMLVDGGARAKALAQSVARTAPNTRFRCVGPIETSEALADAVRAARLLVCCEHRAPTRLSHWVNRIAIAQQKVAAFGWAAQATGLAGPIVFPREGPCLLCWRMRALACADDFEAAMALEERRHAAGAPPAIPTLPGVTSQMAGLLAIEVAKVLGAFGAPTLVGKVVELDALGGRRIEHPVLQRADCPACRGTGTPGRPGPGPERTRDAPTDPAMLRDLVVDASTGIVRSLELIRKDPREPERPYVLRAELANQRFRAKDEEAFLVCSGKGMTLQDAARTAIGEALERYSGYCLAEGAVRQAARADLDTESLDPERLVLFADHQYGALPYARWNADAAIGWTQAVDVGSGEPCAVPAMAVHLGYELSSPDEHLFSLTSNGLAAGPSLDDAVLSAALEAVERDAFMTGWLAQLPASRIPPDLVPDDTLAQLCELYSRRGVAIELYRLPTDMPVAVVAAIGVGEGDDLPAAVIGMGASFDLAVACRKAALEVGQMRPAVRLRLRNPKTRERLDELIADPARVTEIDDHSLLYAAASQLPALDFWRRKATVLADPGPPPPKTVGDRLAALVTALKAVGSRLLAVDLTPPEMAALGVHTARVLLPDFQPLHFGASEARLGGTRLYELPHRLGLRDRRLSLNDICLMPHPLA